MRCPTPPWLLVLICALGCSPKGEHDGKDEITFGESDETAERALDHIEEAVRKAKTFSARVRVVSAVE